MYFLDGVLQFNLMTATVGVLLDTSVVVVFGGVCVLGLVRCWGL